MSFRVVSFPISILRHRKPEVALMITGKSYLKGYKNVTSHTAIGITEILRKRGKLAVYN